MKRLPIIILFVFCLHDVRAQYNLVPNSSFEDHSQCPDDVGGWGQLNYSIGWINPSAGSPDYFHECCLPYILMNDTFYVVGVPENGWGYQNARTGVAYAGFYARQSSPHREYIQVRLNDKLIKDKEYVFSAYISLADKTGLGTKIGALFSDTEIDSDSDNLWQYTAQLITSFSSIDKDNWVLWQDTITSESGNEEYLIIGSFLDVLNSDTIYSGTDSGGYRWSSYYYIDDVSLIPLDSLSGVEEYDRVKFEIYPNPAKESIVIETEFREQTTVRLFDVTGREVLTTSLTADKTTIDVSGFAGGVYTAVLLEGDVAVGRRKILVE